MKIMGSSIKTIVANLLLVILITIVVVQSVLIYKSSEMKDESKKEINGKITYSAEVVLKQIKNSEENILKVIRGSECE